MRTFAVSIVVALSAPLVVAQEARFAEDKALLDAAALVRAPSRPASPADTADPAADTEFKARSDLLLAQCRLDMVLARKAAAAADYRAAASHALEVQRRLASLAPTDERDELDLQVEGILSRATRHGVDLALVRRPAPNNPAPIAQPVLASDAQSQPVAADAPAALGPELEWQVSLDAEVREDELRIRVEADEARLAPEGWVQYPADFAANAARRAERTGEVARSESRTGADGNEWYAAVYDIRDLTYVPPDFQPPFGLTMHEETRIAHDRAALRFRSDIFGGYAHDLAAGIPLLTFFGGVDDYALRGPKYSLEKQQEIIQMINAFTSQTSEARIIPLRP